MRRAVVGQRVGRSFRERPLFIKRRAGSGSKINLCNRACLGEALPALPALLLSDGGPMQGVPGAALALSSTCVPSPSFVPCSFASVLSQRTPPRPARQALPRVIATDRLPARPRPAPSASASRHNRTQFTGSILIRPDGVYTGRGVASPSANSGTVGPRRSEPEIRPRRSEALRWRVIQSESTTYA